MGLGSTFGLLLLAVGVWADVDEPPAPAAKSLDLDVKVVFHYGIPETARQAYKFTKTKDILSHPEFDNSRRTLLYINDCFEVNDESSVAITNAYKRAGGYNILTLEWSQLSGNDFFSVLVPGINSVAGNLASNIIIMGANGLNLKDFHVVGFSLGAQLAGLIGREIKARTKGTVAIERITGLDPSLNGLNTEAINADILISLNERDAKFVDIIHTDSGFHGTTDRNGTCEFWPNFGHRYQPGCSVANLYNPALALNDLCSHKRAYLLWAESVLAKDDTTFLAVAAPSFDAFRRGLLNLANIALMGVNCSPKTPRGNYYLQTNGAAPYSRGVAGLNNGLTIITLK